MSGQPEADVITSLEDLYASREFGQLRPEPADLFLAREFGAGQGRARISDLGGTLFASTVVPTAVAGRWRGHPARERALAAVSGVAAAAMVVAGLAAGTMHHPPRGVSALGSSTRSKGGGAIGPGAPNATATAQVPGASSGGSAAFVRASTASPAPTPTATPLPSAAVIVAPPGRTVAFEPAPGPTSAPPRAATPPAGTPAPTTGAVNPLAPVATVATSSTGTANGAVSAASSALATAVPGAPSASAPVATLVGNIGSDVNAALA